MESISAYFERLLMAPWNHFGRLLGCLGALVGGLVFQNLCKQTTKP
jgi:hypothetical protein